MDLQNQFQRSSIENPKRLRPVKKQNVHQGMTQTQYDEQDEEVILDQNLKLVEHRPFGNMKVLYNKKCLITLGPDYLCFIPTFIVFIVVSILSVRQVFLTTENLYLRAISLTITLGQCLSYLLVATSNPGLVMDPQTPQKDPSKKNCKKCGFQVPTSSRHCLDCDMCIQGYDHHCPWTSKCIGSNNLCRFYIFLAMTPIYLVYTIIAFVFCMSLQLNHVQRLSGKQF